VQAVGFAAVVVAAAATTRDDGMIGAAVAVVDVAGAVAAVMVVETGTGAGAVVVEATGTVVEIVSEKTATVALTVTGIGLLGLEVEQLQAVLALLLVVLAWKDNRQINIWILWHFWRRCIRQVSLLTGEANKVQSFAS